MRDIPATSAMVSASGNYIDVYHAEDSRLQLDVPQEQGITYEALRMHLVLSYEAMFEWAFQRQHDPNIVSMLADDQEWLELVGHVRHALVKMRDFIASGNSSMGEPSALEQEHTTQLNRAIEVYNCYLENRPPPDIALTMN